MDEPLTIAAETTISHHLKLTLGRCRFCLSQILLQRYRRALAKNVTRSRPAFRFPFTVALDLRHRNSYRRRYLDAFISYLVTHPLQRLRRTARVRCATCQSACGDA